MLRDFYFFAPLLQANTDSPAVFDISSSAFIARTELPRGSSRGDQAQMQPRPGITDSTPPPTPLLVGRPMAKAVMPEYSLVPVVSMSAHRHARDGGQMSAARHDRRSPGDAGRALCAASGLVQPP